jgi:hypothetical protein
MRSFFINIYIEAIWLSPYRALNPVDVVYPRLLPGVINIEPLSRHLIANPHLINIVLQQKYLHEISGI